ncbi:hypothetical protein [Nocardioides speluncae]|uniref:hypothetical protein n=1 Tax=Nocardioides speluncae TaxID=2670337 RepID=UPI0012B168D2|nr:hypothetical protein [Nocardioides speluncae]
MNEDTSGRRCPACNGDGWVSGEIKAPPGIAGSAPQPFGCEECDGSGRFADRPPV